MGIFFQILAKTESQGQVPDLPELQFDTSTYYFEVIFFLLVVLGTAFLFIKYLLPRLGPFKKFGKDKVRVSARLPLDGRKSIYVLELPEQGKEILVGTSDTQVNFLCEMSPKQESLEKDDQN